MKLKEVYLLNGDGYGDGNGDGYGDGNGDGNGNGYGYGYGNGYGDGNGYGNGNGNSYGYGYGDGDGNGYGNGSYYAKIWGKLLEVSGELNNSLCINIPESCYSKIDKDFIKSVNNLESLRALREKIGLEKYIQLLEAKIINEQTDHQGNKMKLYKYDEQGIMVLLLEVICPSTDRMYHLYPPNQKAKDCFEAKASTFGDKAISFRHGDVGLFEINSQGKITVPFSET